LLRSSWPESAGRASGVRPAGWSYVRGSGEHRSVCQQRTWLRSSCSERDQSGGGPSHTRHTYGHVVAPSVLLASAFVPPYWFFHRCQVDSVTCLSTPLTPSQCHKSTRQVTLPGHFGRLAIGHPGHQGPPVALGGHDSGTFFPKVRRRTMRST
jgi:hypothetical protein